MGTSPEELSEELESNDTTLRTVPDIAATATAAEPVEPADQHADLSRKSYGPEMLHKTNQTDGERSEEPLFYLQPLVWLAVLLAISPDAGPQTDTKPNPLETTCIGEKLREVP